MYFEDSVAVVLDEVLGPSYWAIRQEYGQSNKQQASNVLKGNNEDT